MKEVESKLCYLISCQSLNYFKAQSPLTKQDFGRQMLGQMVFQGIHAYYLVLSLFKNLPQFPQISSSLLTRFSDTKIKPFVRIQIFHGETLTSMSQDETGKHVAGRMSEKMSTPNFLATLRVRLLIQRSLLDQPAHPPNIHQTALALYFMTRCAAAYSPRYALAFWEAWVMLTLHSQRVAFKYMGGREGE